MQNYAISSEKSNVFSQFSAWRNKKAQELSNKEVNKIISLRNDKTHADEALWVIRVILFIATAFTAYCAFLFYQKTFGQIFPPTATVISAIAFAIASELAKIFLTHRGLRSIFFGWMFKNFWNMGGWLFICSLGVGAYVWSINISTDGMSMLTRQITEDSTPRGDIAAEIAAATSSIDEQIAAANGAQSRAMEIKWRGNTTVDGQRIAKSNARQIEALQAQRAKIIDQVTADHQVASTVRQENISNWAYWIERYGGYMEAVAALCLFSIVFFERRLVAENMNAANSPTPSPAPVNYPATPTPPQHTPTPPRHNGAPLSEQRSFHNATPSPVRDSAALSGTNTRPAAGLDGDFIRLRLKALKGWDDNFGKPGNKAETVAQNMCRILNEIGQQMTRPEFRPDDNSVHDLLEYITETGFPVLEKNGFRYQYADDLKKLCTEYLPASAAA